jgi:hypothetical protein
VLFLGVGSFLLLLAVVYMIVVPGLRPDPAEETAEPSDAMARKERLLQDIRELDMDLATGKLEETDHHRFRARALADTADTLRELERELEEPAEAGGVQPAAPEERLEALITARKREMELEGCLSCGGATDQEDAFCRRCGSPVARRADR